MNKQDEQVTKGNSQANSTVPKFTIDDIFNTVIANRDTPVSVSDSGSTHIDVLYNNQASQATKDAISQERIDQSKYLNNPEVAALQKTKAEQEVINGQKKLDLLNEREAIQNRESWTDSIPMMLKAFAMPLLYNDLEKEWDLRQNAKELATVDATYQATEQLYDAKSKKAAGVNSFDMKMADEIQADFLAQNKAASYNKGYTLSDTNKHLVDLAKLKQQKSKEGYAKHNEIKANSESSSIIDYFNNADNGALKNDSRLAAAQMTLDEGNNQFSSGNDAQANAAYGNLFTETNKIKEDYKKTLNSAEQNIFDEVVANKGVLLDTSADKGYDVLLTKTDLPDTSLNLSNPLDATISQANDLYNSTLQMEINNLDGKDKARIAKEYSLQTGKQVDVENFHEMQMAFVMLNKNKKFADKNVEALINSINPKEIYSRVLPKAREQANFDKIVTNEFENHVINVIEKVGSETGNTKFTSIIDKLNANYKEDAAKGKTKLQALNDYAANLFKAGYLNQNEFGQIHALINSPKQADTFLQAFNNKYSYQGSMASKAMGAALQHSSVDKLVKQYQNNLSN